MQKNKLSLVIPCYNEEKNISFLVNELEKTFKGFNGIEVILVDNGSIDNTYGNLVKESKKCNFIKIERIEKNIGYGNGIYVGLKAATGEILAWTHADLQTHPSDVIKAYDLFNKASSKNILVKGYRKGRKLSESLFSFFMQMFSSVVLGKYFSEINAQPKLFHRDLFNLLINPPLDFSFDLYVLYMAKKNNFKILSIPVYFKERLYGEAKGGSGSDLKTKWKLIKRTFSYVLELRGKINRGIV